MEKNLENPFKSLKIIESYNLVPISEIVYMPYPSEALLKLSSKMCMWCLNTGKMISENIKNE